MYKFILLLHLLGATLWTGGHLVLALVFLPRALRNKEPLLILDFESGYEKIGMPALIVQVLTGFWLAHRLLPDWMHWFNAEDATSRLVLAKIVLLVLTLVLAAHARLRLIPRLAPGNLNLLAGHIIAVTLLAVLFVATGIGFRIGGFF
ncbi:MAG: CopD family protein [Gammaproteobacteria bacterium]